MTPIIALIGRSNVGKSTLFNRLTRTKDALVGDFYALTRDRKYGKARFLEQEFIIIDTCGLDDLEERIKSCNIAFQALLGIKEADIIFFVVDARSGLMPGDYEINKYLRNFKKDIYLVANKIDGVNIDIVLGDFYALGIKNIHPISASHGHGISQLVKKVMSIYSSQLLISNIKISEEKVHCSYWKDQKKEAAIKNVKNNGFDINSVPIKLAIVGQPNVGKSTLANHILGEERVIVYDLPGTTRDSIYIPMERNGYKYILIDTAGIRKRKKIVENIERFSIIKTFESIKDANVVLLLIDAQKGISDQDLSLLELILNIGRSIIIGVNKWDSITKWDRALLKDIINLRLSFINFIKIHFISALNGHGVSQLFESIHKAYESATRQVSAALLTRIMKIAEEEHQPITIRGRRIKMKYAHPGGYNPLIIVIHGNQVTHLPEFYKRYLMNYFRCTLKLISTPIHIQFKENDNPYNNKKNKLRSMKLNKYKHLILHSKRLLTKKSILK